MWMLMPVLLSACGGSSVSELKLQSPELAGASQAGIATSPGQRPNEQVAAVAALTSVSTPPATSYQVGPLDVIEISVFKVPELSKVVQVSEAGTINYPLVGEVDTAGKTARDIERSLTKSLGEKYLQNPQVNVRVVEHNSSRVTVEGAVKQPGVFPLKGSMTLLQAIATAQGLDRSVSDGEVLVFRQVNGKRAAARFGISDIRKGVAGDPQLQAGDVVVASSSALKETFSGFLKALPLAGAFALL